MLCFFVESSLSYFLFCCFSHSIIKTVQTESPVYVCPSGVEKYKGSGDKCRIVKSSKDLRKNEEISWLKKEQDSEKGSLQFNKKETEIPTQVWRPDQCSHANTVKDGSK